MAIEDSKDKQIQDLLENNYPLKAIKVDFKDLTNKNYVIKSSFTESYKKLDDVEKKDNWFYIASLNIVNNCIDLIGLVDMVIGEGWLKLYYLETNKVFKKKNYSKEIIIYLKKFTQFRHLKGIKAFCEKTEDFPLFKYNGFVPVGNNSLEMKWENL